MTTAAIVIYLVSVAWLWNYVRICYSPKGVDRHLTPTMKDVVIVLCPVVNTIFSLFSLSESPYAKEYRCSVNWFFLIKKKH